MYSSFDVLHTEYIVNNISKFSIYLKKIQCFRHKDVSVKDIYGRVPNLSCNLSSETNKYSVCQLPIEKEIKMLLRELENYSYSFPNVVIVNVI